MYDFNFLENKLREVREVMFDGSAFQSTGPANRVNLLRDSSLEIELFKCCLSFTLKFEIRVGGRI